MAIVDEVKKIIKPILDKNGVSIFEITYQKEGKEFVLRILLEKTDASHLSLDEIVDISEAISPLLDETDIIKDENYMLDVASAGAEHPIKIDELEKYVNCYINIHLINPLDGENNYEGVLINLNDLEVSLQIKIKTRTKNIVIKRSNIDRARLAIKF